MSHYWYMSHFISFLILVVKISLNFYHSTQFIGLWFWGNSYLYIICTETSYSICESTIWENSVNCVEADLISRGISHLFPNKLLFTLLLLSLPFQAPIETSYSFGKSITWLNSINYELHRHHVVSLDIHQYFLRSHCAK